MDKKVNKWIQKKGKWGGRGEGGVMLYSYSPSAGVTPIPPPLLGAVSLQNHRLGESLFFRSDFFNKITNFNQFWWLFLYKLNLKEKYWRYILVVISLKKETKIMVQKKSSFLAILIKNLQNFSPLFTGHFFYKLTPKVIFLKKSPKKPGRRFYASR